MDVPGMRALPLRFAIWAVLVGTSLAWRQPDGRTLDRRLLQSSPVRWVCYACLMRKTSCHDAEGVCMNAIA